VADNEAKMTLAEVEIDRLDGFTLGNPRELPPEQALALMNSIRELGYSSPIVTRRDGDRLEILDGHHRLKALRALGYTTAPVVVLEGVDDRQAAALVLALNQLHGDWLIEDLGKFLEQAQQELLVEMDLLAQTSGFTPQELDRLLDTSWLADLRAGEVEVPDEVMDRLSGQAPRTRTLLLLAEEWVLVQGWLEMLARQYGVDEEDDRRRWGVALWFFVMDYVDDNEQENPPNEHEKTTNRDEDVGSNGQEGQIASQETR
jgi:ParB-like chromosome segregation protein Spo0J